MTAPALPTEESFPVWADLEDNWRAVDAHWIRDRLVHVFDDAGERTAVFTASSVTPRAGMLSYLKGGNPDSPSGSLEFRNATAWEPVRYPNLTVSSDTTSVSLRRTGGTAGLTIGNDSIISVPMLSAGTGGLGVFLDEDGVFIKTGTKSVKLSTDTTQLLVDSPLKVTGDIESTAALKGASATLTGNLNVVNATLSGTLAASSAAFSHATTPTTAVVFRAGGDAEIAVDTALAVFRNRQSTANRLSFSSTGVAVLTGSTVTVNGATTVANAATFNGTTSFVGVPSLTPAGLTPAPVAGVIAMNRAPTGSDNYPNGTIWLHI